MSFRTRFLVAVLYLAASLPFQGFLVAHAQQPAAGASNASGTIHGLITDPDDALIPGATVTLTPATGKPQIVTSGSDGTYTVRGAAPGTYVMTVTAPGFGVFVKEGVR